MTRSQVAALKKRLGEVTEQIEDTQALLQQLHAERSVIEAELRGHEYRRRRQAKRKRP